MNDYEKLLYKSNKQKRQLGILIKKITYYKQELQRKDNIINELKEHISEAWKVLDESPEGSFYEGYDTCIEEMKKDILDKIKELEESK